MAPVAAEGPNGSGCDDSGTREEQVFVARLAASDPDAWVPPGTELLLPAGDLVEHGVHELREDA
eukprot:6026043-Alexandrium_andersonii.AAC.1